jgi:DNA-binding NtrC family response regulator
VVVGDAGGQVTLRRRKMNPPGELMGQSPGMVAIREQVRRLLGRQATCRRHLPILILGETGTGKGCLAQTIHEGGPRAAGPFIDVNCAALPETLLEAELFGFERSAFTGAQRAKPGLFQAANGGTLFLDELSLLPRSLQAKLLKVVEQRSVRRLGSIRDEPVDVCLLAAASDDLLTHTREGRFREDLYYRLAVVSLQLPPLRERGQDIVLLAEHFLARACAAYGIAPKSLTAGAVTALLEYSWPGNVRELVNLMERVALLSDAPQVTATALQFTRIQTARPTTALAADGIRGLRGTLDGVERESLLEALGQSGWNVSRAAARLGIPRNTLRYRMVKHELAPIEPPRPSAGTRQRGSAAPPLLTTKE